MPPVRFQITQVSMLPNSSSPASARSRAPSTLSRIHPTFGPRSRSRAAGRSCRRKRSWPPSAASSSHELVGARVLPDDRVVDRLAGRAVPDDCRLALVGDAQRGDVARRRRPVERPSDHLLRALPDLHRVVLDPARLGIDLLVLLLVEPTTLPPWSKIMQRVLVVPWSSAAAYLPTRSPPFSCGQPPRRIAPRR